MGLTEYILLALVILIPLILAVMVTLWSIKQATFRSKKHRKQWEAPVVAATKDERAARQDEAVSNSPSD